MLTLVDANARQQPRQAPSAAASTAPRGQGDRHQTQARRRNVGRLDIVCTHPSGQPIAIEVDFPLQDLVNRKARAEADAGKLVTWVNGRVEP